MILSNFLKKLEKQGFLKKEDIGLDQVKALLSSSSRNLIASEKNIKIDEEACYSLAYNAMLKIGRALVFLQGYRPSDGKQHLTTIEVAGKILGDEFSTLIDSFDRMRRKRNQFTYDPMFPLSLSEAKKALETATMFNKKVKSYLRKQYSQLDLFED